MLYNTGCNQTKYEKCNPTFTLYLNYQRGVISCELFTLGNIGIIMKMTSNCDLSACISTKSGYFKKEPPLYG